MSITLKKKKGTRNCFQTEMWQGALSLINASSEWDSGSPVCCTHPLGQCRQSATNTAQASHYKKNQPTNQTNKNNNPQNSNKKQTKIQIWLRERDLGTRDYLAPQAPLPGGMGLDIFPRENQDPPLSQQADTDRVHSEGLRST